MYGLLEVAIALCVAVSPWLIDWIGAQYIGLGGQEALGLVGATAAALGACRDDHGRPDIFDGRHTAGCGEGRDAGQRCTSWALAILYGSNTLGAVFGTAVATFLALERLGTRTTLWAGCAIGLAAGAMAIVLSRKHLLPPISDSTYDGNSAERLAAKVLAKVDSAEVARVPTSSTSPRRCSASHFSRSSWCGIACSRPSWEEQRSHLG